MFRDHNLENPVPVNTMVLSFFEVSEEANSDELAVGHYFHEAVIGDDERVDQNPDLEVSVYGPFETLEKAQEFAKNAVENDLIPAMPLPHELMAYVEDVVEDVVDEYMAEEAVFANDPLIQVGFKKLSPDATIPSYASAGAAGFDLRASHALVVYPGERRLVQTGLAAELPEGFELQIRPRSGLALKHGVTVLNAPGTIDSDYRGDIGVILFNSSEYAFTVNAGDRIAQAVFGFAPQVPIVEIAQVSETERGEGGFGSTGAN